MLQDMVQNFVEMLDLYQILHLHFSSDGIHQNGYCL